MHSHSKLRVSTGVVPAAMALLGTAPFTPLLTSSVLAQDAGPREAVITSARRQQITLGIGSDDGAQRGAIYAVMRGGQPQARMQITEVRRTDSTANLLSVATDFIVTVGDVARFLELGALPAAPEPQPATPPSVTAPAGGNTANVAPSSSTPLTPIAPTLKPLPTLPTGQPIKTMPISASSVALASVDGTNVTLNAGAQRGIKAGATLPVLRDGNVVALVRVLAVNPANATGTILWRDEIWAPVAGDIIGVTSGAAPAIMEVAPGVPAAPIRFETGASNIVVPKADATYLYLAGLAAQGLITSQPAHVFNDEGVRRHRTAEDITFTRAHIAGLIREALSSPKAENASSKNRVALGQLVNEYGRELRTLGVSDAAVAPFSQSKGFEFGVSGQQRLSLLGGDNDNFRPPFSESGPVVPGTLSNPRGFRTRSGLDTRTNLWARSGDFSFLGSVDAGSDPVRGVNDRSYFVRRALLSYNANKLLRGLTIDVGRNELWFGPGHFGTLLLSDNAGPLNMIHATLKRGSWVAESVYAPLGSAPNGAKRSFYAKNTYLNIGSQTRIGVIESVVDATDSLSPKLLLATFSPIPLALAERIGDETGNLSGELYIESSIARGARVYAELLADDFGANNNNRIRNRYASLLGAHLFSPRNPSKLGAYVEFANLQGRTYLDLSANRPGYDAYYRGVPLGYPVAPVFGPVIPGSIGLGGAETLRFEGYWRATSKLRLGGGMEYADLNSEATAPGANLSRQQIIRLNASYDFRRDITVSARFTRASTSQPNFIFNEPKVTQNLFSLEIARAF